MRNPGRQASLLKFVKEAKAEALSGLNEEQLEAFSELEGFFLDESFAIPAGFDKDGNVMWMTGLGLPQEDAIDLMRPSGAYFRLRPEIKIAVDQALGVDVQKSLAYGNAIGLKESYKASELQFLFSKIFKDRVSREGVQDIVNDPEKGNIFVNSFVKLLDLKARTVAKKDPLTGITKEDFEFTADPRRLNLIRNSMIARFLTTAKQFGDPYIDETKQLVRTMTGITLFRQNLAQTANLQKFQLQKDLEHEERKAGKGGAFRKLTSKDPGVRAVNKLVDAPKL